MALTVSAARYGALIARIALFAFVLRCAAQTVVVDAQPGHSVNAFRPNEALGAGVDRLPYGAADRLFVPETIEKVHSAGWQPITYRQNTELHAEAWHWNPRGVWSSPGERGYFVGDAEPALQPILHSYGYPLPRRGVTRDDGTDLVGYSRLTDGDPASFWKSNPYLAAEYTGEDDSAHPQWVFLDLAGRQPVDAIRIDWAQPYAQDYLVQYWTGADPIHKPADGAWQMFPNGRVQGGHGGRASLRLAGEPVAVQYVRVWMTRSSRTCAPAARRDPRDCVGYAIGEIALGTQDARGQFHDLVRHTPDQDQTATYCSSIDPWHEARDLDEHAGEQVGFDRFYSSGITRGLPAMVPIAMLYSTPEDAVHELRYLARRGYKVSYVEMGEEPDGHYTVPEDYAALYVQFAAALHRFDPALKLGGPIFTGQNEDIQTWADASGAVSWTGRFIDYLKARGKLGELAFFSFEHYPVDPGKVAWSSLYDEAQLVAHIMKVWREDGVPADVPLFITESNLSSQPSEAYLDIWSALWLADYVGGFFAAGGSALYYFHDLPGEMAPGFHASPGTFNFFTADEHLQIRQPLAQYFASRMINFDWVQPGDGLHRVFSAASDVDDGAGHALVSAYPLLRPDGQWSMLLVNKDQDNAHAVRIEFRDGARGRSGGFDGPVTATIFGRAQYQWHPGADGGHADPDGPPATGTIDAGPVTPFTLPAASIVVLRGRVAL